MKLHIEKTSISADILHLAYFDEDSHPLSFRRVVELWAGADATFLADHNQVLSDIPFRAFKWETPVVDVERYDRPFEFVALNSPRLDRPENPSAFKEHFARSDSSDAILQFPNLGGNAILVVPKPCGPEVNHCHLASFLDTCHAADESELWRKVGNAMLERVSDKPVWLSTAGGGVPWLHVRLDDRPKYYGYAPFKAD